MRPRAAGPYEAGTGGADQRRLFSWPEPFDDVKPGRLDKFLVAVRQLELVLARVDVGLTGMRVLRYMVAGADSGRIALLFENTDLAS